MTFREVEAPPYPFLRRLPANWQVQPLDRLVIETKQRNSDDSEMNVLSLSYGRIVKRDIESNSGLLPESFSTYQIVESGQIILRLTDLQNDKTSLRVGRVTERGIISPAYVAIQMHSGLVSRYAYYVLHFYDQAKFFYSFGGGVRQSMRFTDLRKLLIPVPSVPTQTAIADFLDRRTAAIDALIEKKERMIELLDEKRAALVHRAVTKGLDPDVPMKDSGIPWIGEIPAHWELIKLGWHFAIGNGSTPSRQEPEYWGGTIPWLNSGTVNQGVIESSTQFVTDRAISECHLPQVQPGSVLVAITGEGQTRGRAALLTQPATLSQHLAYLTPRSERLRTGFLRRSLEAAYSWLRLESSGIGSTRAALTCDYLRGFQIAAPPLEEQAQIEKEVEVGVRRAGKTAARLNDQIDRLKEYRQALITQAVTGQLEIPEAA